MMIKKFAFNLATKELMSVESMISSDLAKILADLGQIVLDFDVSVLEGDVSHYIFTLNEDLKSFSFSKNNEILLDIAKKQKIVEIENNHFKSLSMRVVNGVDITIHLKAPEGEALLEIVNKAGGNFFDESRMFLNQTFFVTEHGIVGSQQMETTMSNWLWYYIFGELPAYKRTQKQIKESLLNSISNAKTTEAVSEISANFGEGIQIDISATIKHILSTDVDIVDGVQIQIPEVVKKSLRELNREVFSESNPNKLRNTVSDMIMISFFEDKKDD